MFIIKNDNNNVCEDRSAFEAWRSAEAILIKQGAYDVRKYIFN